MESAVSAPAAATVPFYDGRAGVGAVDARTHVQLVSNLADLKPLTGPWRELARQALSANPVYGPDMMLAALEHLDKRYHPDQVLVIWRAIRGGRREMAGFLPFSLQPLVPVLPGRVLAGWSHPYAFSGVPLIHREYAIQTMNAFLDWFSNSGGAGLACLMPLAPAGGVFFDVLETACHQKDAPLKVLNGFERPFLSAATGDREIVWKGLSRSRRRTYTKQINRLDKLGKVVFSAMPADDDPQPWIDCFLSLEAKGWKGRRGSALNCDRATAAFFNEAARAAAHQGQLRVYRLALDGKSLAVTVAFEQGGTLFFFKMAYDEDHAALSPGMQLFLHISAHLQACGDLRLADACTDSRNPTLNALWPERRPMADLLIGAPGSRVGAALAGFVVEHRTVLRDMMRTAYHAIRRKR
jgi:CelD/BcsL family acetyltransferase involved in cellulose biosynthesis